MLSSVVWTVVLALVAAVAVVILMAARRRPQGGWREWLRGSLSTEEFAAPAEEPRQRRRELRATGVLAEYEQAIDGDTVSIFDILADAEPASGYIEVPAPIEQRIEELTAPVENGLAALNERVSRAQAQRAK